MASSSSFLHAGNAVDRLMHGRRSPLAATVDTWAELRSHFPMVPLLQRAHQRPAAFAPVMPNPFGLVVLGEHGVEPGADQAAERDLLLVGDLPQLVPSGSTWMAIITRGGRSSWGSTGRRARPLEVSARACSRSGTDFDI